MQILRKFPVDADQYVDSRYQFRVAPPKKCPNCGRLGAMEALGYYARNLVTGTGKARRITIRRFRCRTCHRTVSILPAFAQPYRLIQNPMIHQVFQGDIGKESAAWIALIQSYWKRFTKWLPNLRRAVGENISRAPPYRSALDWWNLLTTLHGSISAITTKFVEQYGFTLFGRYACHSPSP